jgi:hypothetical protein
MDDSCLADKTEQREKDKTNDTSSHIGFDCVLQIFGVENTTAGEVVVKKALLFIG